MVNIKVCLIGFNKVRHPLSSTRGRKTHPKNPFIRGKLERVTWTEEHHQNYNIYNVD